MARAAENGFITFDLAGIYGPAEGFVGSFVGGKYASPVAKECQYFTKWVLRPGKITKTEVDDASGRSLVHMNTEQLDLLHFHWWDYDNEYYFNAMDGLMDLKQREQIRSTWSSSWTRGHPL